MQDEIADILEDMARKIRGRHASKGRALENLTLLYWEFCTVETARTLVKHGQDPADLLAFLVAAAYEIAPGSAKEKDDAVMQMVMRCRSADTMIVITE